MSCMSRFWRLDSYEYSENREAGSKAGSSTGSRSQVENGIESGFEADWSKTVERICTLLAFWSLFLVRQSKNKIEHAHTSQYPGSGRYFFYSAREGFDHCV